jgi:hypothetical protein
VFFQSPYQLSATYVASAVRIEESTGTPVEAPPVLQPQLTVRGLLQPTIISALNASDPRAPVASTSVLQITGSGLRGDRTVVRVGPSELTPQTADIHATTVQVALTGRPSCARDSSPWSLPTSGWSATPRASRAAARPATRWV